MPRNARNVMDTAKYQKLALWLARVPQEDLDGKTVVDVVRMAETSLGYPVSRGALETAIETTERSWERPRAPTSGSGSAAIWRHIHELREELDTLKREMVSLRTRLGDQPASPVANHIRRLGE